MDEPTFETALSTFNSTSITVREKDLVDEVMGNMSFTESLFYLWSGREPNPTEVELVDAMLVSMMVHGTTPHAIATRLTYFSEPESVQGAVASGLIGVGSRLAGSMQECAEILQDIENGDQTVDEFIDATLASDSLIPGLGHPHFEGSDPRADILFDIARGGDVKDRHTQILHVIRDEYHERTDSFLVINLTGAMAALTSDMGLSPPAARGFAIISRAAGLMAEVIEEDESPWARRLWENVNDR